MTDTWLAAECPAVLIDLGQGAGLAHADPVSSYLRSVVLLIDLAAGL